MRLLSRLALPSAFLLVAGNVVLEHYAAPNGSMLGPLVAGISTWLVLVSGPLRSLYVSAGACAFFLAVQDLGLKLWGGGSHDAEGQGAENFLLLVGALLSAGLLGWYLRRQPSYNWRHKVGALVLFVLLILGHFQLCADVGYGLSYDL